MQNIFIGFILGLIGSSVGAFIAYRFTICRDRRNKFNNAAISFQKSFLDELRMLKRHPLPDKSNSACHILSIATFNRHEMAMLVFSTYLCREQRTRFKKVWREYAYGDDATETDPQPGEYFRTEQTFDEMQMREKAIHRIETLLVFAKIE